MLFSCINKDTLEETVHVDSDDNAFLTCRRVTDNDSIQLIQIVTHSDTYSDTNEGVSMQLCNENYECCSTGGLDELHPAFNAVNVCVSKYNWLVANIQVINVNENILNF